MLLYTWRRKRPQGAHGGDYGRIVTLNRLGNSDGNSGAGDFNAETARVCACAPDRIVVGEVRGPEALSLLKAWNTGHPGGCATVHANNARAGLTHLEQLIQEAVITVPRELIAEAVDIVIHIERVGHGRKIKETSRVEGVEAGRYLMTGID
jgi:type IV secretion system protein VirB11